MARRRGSGDPPLSLFSFQDLITCITGIMILVVLLQMLDVISRKMTGPAVAAEETAPAATAEVENLLSELNDLEARVEAGAGALKDIGDKDPKRVEERLRELEAERQRLAETLARLGRDTGTQREVAARAAEAAAAYRRTVAALEKETAELQALLDQLSKQPHVTFEYPPGAHKTPVLVQCSRAGIEASVLGEPREIHSFIGPSFGDAQGSLRAFLQWAASRRKDADAFFVLVKPSSASYANHVIDRLDKAGFDVGYEPFEEAATAIFRQEAGP